MRERLFRSRKSRVIGGVCGGLAEYFNIDPVIVRIVFAVMLILHGIGVIAYIILWIAIPEESMEHYYGRFAQNPSAEPGTPPAPAPEGTTGTPAAEPAQNSNTAPGMMFNYDIPKKKNSGAVVWGVILIIIGLLFLFWTILPWFDFELYFPILLVIGGIFLIFNSIIKKG